MEGKRISQLTPDTSPSTDDFIVSVDGTTMQNKRVDFGSLPVSNPTVALFDTKVNKAGDTMTGNLIVPAPTQPTHATTKSYVDNRTPIYGTGFPNGVVSATPGRIYLDENITSGASSWIKKSGTGNTGWQVLEGDTGWRNIATSINPTGYFAVADTDVSYLRIRRINNIVFVLGRVDTLQTVTSAPQQLVVNSAIYGFLAEVQYAPIINYEVSNAWGATTTIIGRSSFSASSSDFAQFPTGRNISIERSWSTTNPWPTSLPGSGV